MARPKGQASVVISYARGDAEFVIRLVEALRDAKISVWIDQGGISGALLWGEEIVQAICGCQMVILVASSATYGSVGVTKEILIAAEERKPILPIHLEPVEIPASLRLPLAGIQRIDWYSDDWDANMDAVLRSLERLGVSQGAKRARRRPAEAKETEGVVTRGSAVNPERGDVTIALSGVWQGSWIRISGKVPAEGILHLQQRGVLVSGSLAITFRKGEAATVIQERIEGRISDRTVSFKAKHWVYVFRGFAEPFLRNDDEYELIVKPDGKRMSGTFDSQRGRGRASFTLVSGASG